MIPSRMVAMVVVTSGKTVEIFEGSAKEDLLVGSRVATSCEELTHWKRP